MSNTGYWILFGISQVAAVVVASLGNAHTHPVPFILANILLFPGCLVEFVPRITGATAMILIFPINLAAWYLVRKFLLADSR